MVRWVGWYISRISKNMTLGSADQVWLGMGLASNVLQTFASKCAR